MGILSGIGGLVGGLGGLFGNSNANSVTPPASFQLPNQGQAANNAFTGMSNFQNIYGSLGQGTLPYAQNIFSNLYGNPYAGLFQSGAGTASNMGTSAATGAYDAGMNLTGAGSNLLPYATNIMNTAADPQNALYARTLQQVTDQTRAGLETRGLDNTPYGAGVEGQALSNFNIDWQNNLLQRQATGAQAAGGLVGAAGNAINTGAGIWNTAPGQYLTAASLPYSTYAGIGAGQQSALSNLQSSYGTSANLGNLPIQNWLAYLSAGNQSNATANNLFSSELTQNALANQQNMQYGGMLGQGLASLAKGWGNSQNAPLLGNLSLPSLNFG